MTLSDLQATQLLQASSNAISSTAVHQLTLISLCLPLALYYTAPTI